MFQQHISFETNNNVKIAFELALIYNQVTLLTDTERNTNIKLIPFKNKNSSAEWDATAPEIIAQITQ